MIAASDPDDHSDALDELAASLDAMPCVLATDVHRDTPAGTGDWLEVCVAETFVTPAVLSEIARAGLCITGVQPKCDVASIVNVKKLPNQ